jgi:3-phenylpropionate/trans-cinnamate dioxygenase ferredoxin reductase component
VNRQHVKYLIAGGGVAGSAAVEAIRRHDPAGSVLFVGQEVNRPYNRSALSKGYLLRRTVRADLTALPIGWYAERHVELRTGRRVTHVDPARTCVALDSGEEISYDKLLLATGAGAKPLKIPGAELPNVYSLRTLGDAERLLHAIDTAKSSGRRSCAVIGAGLLGTELAATIAQAGLHVNLIETGETPWPALAGPITGQFLARLLQHHGVSVHCGETVEKLEGDGRVQLLFTSSGTMVHCDFVVAAVGTQINRDLLRGTPIAAETAILVDARCETSVPGIYAAGDCCAILDPLFGKHRLLDHWDNARVTGNLAGTNMAGGDERYETVNYFSSKLFDEEACGGQASAATRTMQVAHSQTGHVWGEAKLVYRRLLRGLPGDHAPRSGANPATGSEFAEIGIAADGRVAQVISFGRKCEHEQLAKLVAKRVLVDGNEEDLKDTGRSLASILA